MTVLRPILTVTLPICLLAAPLAAKAQQPAKAARIGFLGSGTPAEAAPRLESFRQGLRDLGYVEGRDVVIEYRWAEGKFERLPDIAVELVGLKVDVIVATSSPAALAAKNATRTIPIVFVTAGDPVGSLVAGIARPGGNITGLSLLAPEIVARQLQLLKEAVPKASRVAVLSNAANLYTAVMVKEIESAARSLGVRVQLLGVRGTDAFDRAFSAVTKERPGALLVLFDPLLFAYRTRIVEFANKSRLPGMYPHREYAEAGGLMAYGSDLRDNFRRAATYVDKILKGARPADLPVEQPTKFELVINLQTAKALGLTIPQSLLLQADEVIK
jgi:putative ABC transport system substrate-binding protein